jgi:hypothetical protein
MAYAIQKVAFDVVIAGFSTRSNPDAKIAIPFGEITGPLFPDGHICPPKIYKNSRLIVKLFTKLHPGLIMLVFRFRKKYNLPSL